MALITCPECGKQVSSSATACPSCGYPLKAESDRGYVTIKFPYQIQGGRQRLFGRPKVSVRGENVKWYGELGDIARFAVDGPTVVNIDLGDDAWFISKVTVYPNSKYKLEFVRTKLTLAVYELVEI